MIFCFFFFLSSLTIDGLMAGAVGLGDAYMHRFAMAMAMGFGVLSRGIH